MRCDHPRVVKGMAAKTPKKIRKATIVARRVISSVIVGGETLQGKRSQRALVKEPALGENVRGRLSADLGPGRQERLRRR